MACSVVISLMYTYVFQATDGTFCGGLAFGMTACDPATVRQDELPDDSDLLLDRAEYWVVNKDVCAQPEVADELSFTLTHEGMCDIDNQREMRRMLLSEVLT